MPKFNLMEFLWLMTKDMKEGESVTVYFKLTKVRKAKWWRRDPLDAFEIKLDEHQTDVEGEKK